MAFFFGDIATFVTGFPPGPSCPKCRAPAILFRLSGVLFALLYADFRMTRVFNSQAANRRLAFRVVAVQVVVAVLVSLGFLFQGAQAALAALTSGTAVALGSLLLAWRSLFGPAYSAGLSLARMVSGLILKWFVVLGVLYLSLARWQLPPLPLLAGLVVTMAASFLTQSTKTQVSSER